MFSGGGFLGGEIAEVRSNSGKFLHIYEIPEGYRECKGETFAETVVNINLQKKQEDEFDAEKVAKRYRGVELIFGITASGWYASSASFGEHSVKLQHEHDSTSRNHYTLVVAPCVPDGSFSFYVGRVPVQITLGGEPHITTLTSGTGQSWYYSDIETLTIGKGWIFVDGVDVYEGTVETVNKKKAEKVAARNNKFAEAKAKAIEVGFSGAEIAELIKSAQKGQIIALLTAASAMVVEDNMTTTSVVETIKSLGGEDVAVIRNYAKIANKATELALYSTHHNCGGLIGRRGEKNLILLTMGGFLRSGNPPSRPRDNFVLCYDTFFESASVDSSTTPSKKSLSSGVVVASGLSVSRSWEINNCLYNQ